MHANVIESTSLVPGRRNAAAPLAVIPAGITAVKFEGGHIACHSFEPAAECAAAS